MVDTPAVPVLATIPGVELGSVGYWDISNMLGWHPTAEDMAAAVAALDCPAVRRPVLKLGHTGQPGEGDPCIGLVDDLRLTDEGQTLVGDFVGVPAWLAAADDEGRSVIASAYPDRSGEWEHNYECQLGHTHPFVLHAMSILGVIRPGIGTLESLYDLYTKPPEKEVVVAKAAVALAGITTDEVRKAYYNGPAANDYYLWIREMYVEPAELIVQNDDDDSLLRVPYTVNGDDVEFGDGQPIKVQYVAARAASDKPVVAFASRAEARGPKNPSAAQAEVTEGKEGAMPTLKEGLAQQLGIPADSDDETALKALKEALNEQVQDATNPKPVDPVEITPEQVAARAKSLGLTLVDAEQYASTVAQAQQGAEARKQQLRESDERIVDLAISKGKIPPKRRDHHMQAMAADRDGHRAVLDALPEGLVPLSEVGHGTSPGDAGAVPDDLSWFDSAPTEPSTEREDA